MTTRRRGRRQQARADVVWGLIAFAALQIAFVLAIDLTRPGLFDPEYGVRVRLLRERIREHPERPLLLVVGSSRIGAGFMPGELSALRTADGRLALPFNGAHLGAGPRLNRMEVRRLLREGITPSWLVLEVVPGGLVHEVSPASIAVLGDLPGLCRYNTLARDLLIYLRCRLNPFYNHRQAVLSLLAAPFVTRADSSDHVSLLPLGDDDNWMRREDLDAEMLARRVAEARGVYCDRLRDFHIDPELDRATRELLRLCRQKGIPVVLLLTPEDSRFRSWYSAETEKRLGDYLEGLQRVYRAPVVDARAWVGDDGFSDPHHLRLRGARVFTERLGREVLQPLVAGAFPIDGPDSTAAQALHRQPSRQRCHPAIADHAKRLKTAAKRP